MKFGNLTYLVFLWAIPALIIFFVYSQRKRAKLLNEFANKKLLEKLIPDQKNQRRSVKFGLFLIAIFFLIFSLLGPKWGFHWEEVSRRGVDIVIALDLSNSMLAEDVKPNRLEWAKRKIKDLSSMVEGDRLGLVAFAGTSFVECPLTLDYGAFDIFLDYLDTDLIPVQGTAIGDAIEKSIKIFDEKERRSKALILITDGEDHESDPVKVAETAKAQGVKIFTIGIGREGGAPIPEKDGSGFKKDSGGNLILTKLDEKTLQKIALTTGGIYVRSVSGDLDLKEIYNKGIREEVEEKTIKSSKNKKWEERFQVFVFLAFLFLILEFFMIKKRLKLQNGLLILFAIVISLNSSYASLKSTVRNGNKEFKSEKYDDALKKYIEGEVESPENPILKYNVANTYYKMKDYENALKYYAEVAMNAGDVKLEEKAYYNMGNTMYRLGKLNEAMDFYQKALSLDPNDEDAKFNLEFIRNEIKRRMEEEKKRPQNQKENQQQQNEDKKGDDNKENQSSGEEKSEEKKEASVSDKEGENKEDKKEGEGVTGDEKREISKEEAEALLEGVKEDRKNFDKERLKKGRGERVRGKDW